MIYKKLISLLFISDTPQESIFEQNAAFCLIPEVNTHEEFCLTSHHNKEDKGWEIILTDAKCICL